MIAAQRKLKALLNEESSVKETLTTLTGKAELSDEERAQLGEAEQRYTAMQVEVRAARTLVEAEGEGETRDAAPGATEFQIMSFLGHKTPTEAAHYSAAANRTKLTASGMAKLRAIPGTELSNFHERLDNEGM